LVAIAFTSPVDAAGNATPRNIILLIGDGMGLGQISAAKTVKGVLAMEQFTTVGFLTTHAHDKYVTDSAAAGTALATGRKTYNGAIAVSPVKKKPIKTALEWAEHKGKATGIVVTCSVTHATPATFMAHVDSRKKNEEIAEHIAASDVDVLFGGGLQYFIPKGEKDSKRQDDKNLITMLAKRMQVARSAKDFQQLATDRPAAALLAAEHLPKVEQREVSLAEMTRKAIRILSRDEDGFFLMVEGSQIDWAGHDNDPNYLIAETVDFDDTVRAALDFAQVDGSTLVIVTADHETGGFALLDGSVKKRELTKTGFVSKNHTGVMVPIFASGPGNKVFAGIHDNTIVGKSIIRYLKRSPRFAEQ
jgi:alkaline phosphatase